VELLGRRTAEMHAALAGDQRDSNFVPEPFTPFDQRSLYQSLRRTTAKTLQLLRDKLEQLPPGARSDAQDLLNREQTLMNSLRQILGPKVQVLQMRIHGDFHLEHVLYTGKDFVIVDFEGETGRPLSERRLKRLALVDVACMVRSFHYAVANALNQHLENVATSAEDASILQRSGQAWFRGTTAAFLKSYLAAAAGAPFLPAPHATLQMLLHMLLLRRAMEELNSELKQRIGWAPVPLRAVLGLLTLTPVGEATA
jgi:maltose alpha-D-glucosyltransferase/alpha-amylase